MPPNASSASWDDKYALAAKFVVEELAGALTQAEAPATHSLVAELTGIEDPPPTLIIETIIGLGQPQSQAAPQLLLVEVEPHQPSVNDLMAGAVYPAVQPHRSPEELASLVQDDNDSTLCRYDFRYLDNFMPWKLFGVGDIAQLNILHAPEHVNCLPPDFYTTTLGLKKVWLVIFQGREAAVYNDEQLLTELVKVGGVPRKQDPGCGIVYPEDLVPCTSENEWDDEHRVYWKLLGDLARTSWGEDVAAQDDDEDVI